MDKRNLVQYSHYESDSLPLLLTPIGTLTVCAGSRFNYKIPTETFYDYEAGNTDNLRLYMVENDRSPIPSNFWMHFDEATHMLKGKPTDRDIGITDYLLIAVDMNGGLATDSLHVAVVPRSHFSCKGVKRSRNKRRHRKRTAKQRQERRERRQQRTKDTSKQQ